MKRLISEVNAPAASECLCRGHPLHLLLLLVPLQLHDLLPAEHKLHICVALPHEPRGNVVVSLDVHRNLSGATPDTSQRTRSLGFEERRYHNFFVYKQASISTPPSMGHVPRTVTLEYSSAGRISGSVRGYNDRQAAQRLVVRS